jgi:hypothetical protein
MEEHFLPTCNYRSPCTPKLQAVIKKFFVSTVCIDNYLNNDPSIDCYEARSPEEALDIADEQIVKFINIPGCYSPEECGFMTLGAFETKDEAVQSICEFYGVEKLVDVSARFSYTLNSEKVQVSQA